MKYKTKNELLLKQMEDYMLYLKTLSQNNPELAKVEAKEALVRIGILDKDGNTKPPYNGEKVNLDDFERGPRKIKKLERE